MLTDMILEEEFEIKEEEPWYDQRDLEHDLHLAAELGKSLLDRNRELEQAVQQMYSTNQEQLQEIEYLSKQVDVLRQMNEQHSKVYEQLDATARDLEKGNQRLVQDNRSAQHKIQSLTETVDGLQQHVDELEQQLEELKAPLLGRAGLRRSLGAQSVSCLKELYSVRRYSAYEQVCIEASLSAEALQDQEENVSLQRSVQALRAQVREEQARRVEAEHEAELLAQEAGELGRRLGELEDREPRLRELEAEVDELRRRWRADTDARGPADHLLPDAVFFEPEEQPAPKERHVLTRCGSEGILRGRGEGEELRLGHERSCVRRADVVKQRGISLLNEVDAQYSALQLKYDALLRQCQRGTGGRDHKAVQTPPGSKAQAVRPRSNTEPPARTPLPPDSNSQQPEYKALFQEIFSCIQRTKEDLSGNRRLPSQGQ